MAAGDVNVKSTIIKGLKCNIFDGSNNQRLEIPYDTDQDQVEFAFTISAWVYSRLTGSTKVILRKNGSIQILSDTNLRCVLETGEAIAVSSVTINKWYHILFTFDGSTLKAYGDGVLNETFAATLSHSVAENNIAIGSNGGSSVFNGGMREIKVWKRVLNATEIAQDYAGNTPKTPIHHIKLGGDYQDYGSIGATIDTESIDSIEGILEDNLSIAIKAQRVTANDKYMIAELP